MSYLLQIEQPGRLPLFVRKVRADGSVSVSFRQAPARRFRRKSPTVLHQVAAHVATWSEPGRVTFHPAPV